MTPIRRLKIRVTHPGSNHLAYHLVAALQGLGHDCDFWTGVFYWPESRVGHLLQRLPPRWAGRIERELKRRSHASVDPARVHLHPLPELIYVAAARYGLPLDRLGRVIAWRERRFDDWICRGLNRDRPQVLIGHDASTLGAFRRAEALAVFKVLNQVIGQIRVGLETLREEAALVPEFADSLPVSPPPEVVEGCTAEALAADRLLAGSEYVRDTLVQIGVDRARIDLIPYGVDCERFRPVPRANDGCFRILFVGQLSQRKGIKYLLEAVRRLKLPNAELVLVGGVVGSGKGLAPYREHFRHVTHVPYHEVHALYQQADLFVYPSLHEGSAFATYEAMASGLPVIATPNTGAPIRDGEEGYVVPIRDVETLMQRIETLYRDADLRRELGRAARVRATGFTWADYRRRLAQAIERWEVGG